MEKNFLKERRPTSIIQRFGSPDEVAALIVYTASTQASATTGSALRVDGGVVKAPSDRHAPGGDRHGAGVATGRQPRHQPARERQAACRSRARPAGSSTASRMPVNSTTPARRYRGANDAAISKATPHQVHAASQSCHRAQPLLIWAVHAKV
jgi:hypothetical protein